jgi:hypothetical protein
MIGDFAVGIVFLGDLDDEFCDIRKPFGVDAKMLQFSLYS